MNYIFLTQGTSLPLFYDVFQCLKSKELADKAGFYTAQSDTFDAFENSIDDSASLPVLKEWEITAEALKTSHDLTILKKYEELYGDPVLWNALISDRRIYLGKKAAVEQDYTPRYSYDQMLSILQVATERMEALFDQIQPDAVVGFISVTIGDYLAHLIAKRRNIPLINLRPTRIKNYFYGAETVEEPSSRLINAYEQTLSQGIPKEIREEALSFIVASRSDHAMYEGVIPPSGMKNVKMSKSRGVEKLKLITDTLLYRLTHAPDYLTGKYRHDNFHMNIFKKTFLTRVMNPLRALAARSFLNTSSVSSQNLEAMSYAFYPLHKEPEVQLLVYSRPFMNQIEVIRNLARSLPMGMKLLVKEHPASVGYRPVNYYRSIMSIPNVVLAPPETPSRQLVQHSDLVAIVSGSTGFEALMLKKPVIFLGNVIFGMMPDNMIKHVDNLDNLAKDIQGLLSGYHYDEEALLTYVAAIIQMSVPVDFYSRLLGRKGIFGDSDAATNEAVRNEHIDRLSEYISGLARSEKKI